MYYPLAKRHYRDTVIEDLVCFSCFLDKLHLKKAFFEKFCYEHSNQVKLMDYIKRLTPLARSKNLDEGKLYDKENSWFYDYNVSSINLSKLHHHLRVYLKTHHNIDEAEFSLDHKSHINSLLNSFNALNLSEKEANDLLENLDDNFGFFDGDFIENGSLILQARCSNDKLEWDFIRAFTHHSCLIFQGEPILELSDLSYTDEITHDLKAFRGLVNTKILFDDYSEKDYVIIDCPYTPIALMVTFNNKENAKAFIDFALKEKDMFEIDDYI
jgi:hypothetical protein